MPTRIIKPTFTSLTGSHSSRKVDRQIQWESSLERDLIYLLEFDRAVIHYEEQPVRICFGRNRTYHPDFEVHLREDSLIIPKLKKGEYLIEVKYLYDLRKKFEKYRPKFKAAIGHCKTNHSTFKILTDDQIRSTFLDNIKKIDYFMREESFNELEIRDVISETLGKLVVTNLKTLPKACFKSSDNQLAAIPVIWRMIGTHSIGIDLNSPITPSSEIWTVE
ncbi:TnsA endonuclease N-terminal domain-containing protein [Pleionea mediterranea]|uniref:TnsA endonuclease-like protein n=1 Tax=Pleionea mediterranea TaxID=523701 RepID=A0A316FXL3_9GAMM|nr:TnsA endonuclease N-terminal domain-containing protein [Pleionea mediterranea]PWK52855.1 TnsA endonuclease-like protein [Pleionea mediterranea]